MIDKKRENDFKFIYAYLEIEFMHVLYFMFIKRKGEKDFESLYKKGEKVFREKNFFLIYTCFSHLVYAYIFV